jgi:hypothetical protein
LFASFFRSEEDIEYIESCFFKQWLKPPEGLTDAEVGVYCEYLKAVALRLEMLGFPAAVQEVGPAWNEFPG